MNKRHKKFIWLAAVAIFFLFFAMAGWFIGVPMIRLVEDPAAFRQWVDKFGLIGKLLFIAMVVLQVLVAFIPGEPLELAAGYAFGIVEGTLLSMAGIILGSWLVFALVRRYGVKLVEVFFSDKDIHGLGFLKDPRKTRIIVFILMMIPGTPKDFLSYFAGLTKLTTLQWLRIVAVARIPSLITSTVTGAAAGEKNYILAGAVLLITLVISACGMLYYRALCKEQNVARDDVEQPRRKAS